MGKTPNFVCKCNCVKTKVCVEMQMCRNAKLKKELLLAPSVDLAPGTPEKKRLPLSASFHEMPGIITLGLLRGQGRLLWPMSKQTCEHALHIYSTHVSLPMVDT